MLRRSGCARFLYSGLLLVLVWLAPAGAHAYAIRYAVSPLDGLSVGDDVQVDLYFDADPGLQLLSIGVLWETSRMDFQPLASSSAPVILYTPTPGPGEGGSVARVRDPWIEWPGDKPPGFSQVNIDYWVNDGFPLDPAAIGGTDIWLTSLLFEVTDAAGGPPILDVTLEAAGNILRSNDVILDPADVPITRIPEPAAATLLGLGLALAALAGRRTAPGRG